MRKRMMTVVITLLMVPTLIGCSSAAAPAKETKETEAMVVKEETVEVAEVKEVEAEPTPNPTSEPTAESTPEWTPEPIVYEGIDMESTLPGKEWMATFKGIIEEPKFVVFNDETNKKVIVENEQEVEFVEGDILAIFAPNGILLNNTKGKNIESTSSYDNYYNEVVFNSGEIMFPNNIVYDSYNYDGEKQGEISCTIVESMN